MGQAGAGRSFDALTRCQYWTCPPTAAVGLCFSAGNNKLEGAASRQEIDCDIGS